MLSGWALFGFALANYFVSRWSELRLLRKAGCDSTHDYHTRLCVIEKEAMEARVSFSGHERIFHDDGIEAENDVAIWQAALLMSCSVPRTRHSTMASAVCKLRSRSRGDRIRLLEF